ncbi:hypothetical protein B0H19DRAFT_1066854 [Mycena capillaripes]|nr:hypothetical protein B0H19DRAFT_1066854 [Mycena capillaripes]
MSPTSTQQPREEKENNRSRRQPKSAQTRPHSSKSQWQRCGEHPFRKHPAQIAQTSTSAPQITDESVDRPKNASKIQMREIRRELGDDKKRWNSFRSYCRDAATSARLNWDEVSTVGETVDGVQCDSGGIPRDTPLRSDSGDDEDEDGDEFVAASDHEAPRDEQGEGDGEEEDGVMAEKVKGKRKASGQDGKNPKRARHEYE